MDAEARRRCVPKRTVKPCGPVPPMQGTSPGSKARGDGGKKLVHRGDHGAAVSPLRRECRMISAYLCWPRVRLFCLHARQWVRSCTRHSLRPLSSRRDIDATTRAETRRENAKARLQFRRHSGAPRSGEPGIHSHHARTACRIREKRGAPASVVFCANGPRAKRAREYGFRARAKRRVPE